MTATERSVEEELRDFELGALDPAGFPHSEHVRIGYEILCRHSFGVAIGRFSGGLRLLAVKAERPQLYHETVTVAFLALINERRVQSNAKNWNEFQGQNSDLFDKRCLEKWYSREQLGSDLARRAFCLPSNRRSL